MPLVSIVIPTRNRTKYLAKAIGSVVAQTYRDWELLVVDDSFTNDTFEFVQNIRDARVRYQRSPVQCGPAGKRNQGIDLSRAEFIAFLDDDDIWMATKLEKQVAKFLDGPPNLGVVNCGLRCVSPSGKLLRVWYPRARGNILRDLLISNVVSTPSTVMVRRTLIQQAGAFDEEMVLVEDHEAWLRWSKVCLFDYVDELLVQYLIHGESNQLQRKSADYHRFFARIDQELYAQPKWVRRRAKSTQSLLLATLFSERGDWKRAAQERWRGLLADPSDLVNYLRFILKLFPFTSGLYCALAAAKDRLLAYLYAARDKE